MGNHLVIALGNLRNWPPAKGGKGVWQDQDIFVGKGWKSYRAGNSVLCILNFS